MPEEIINIEKIMEIIPHRYPLLLVDRIIEYKKGESIVGIKNVTINEHFFQGHFPGKPVMPGVLVIEAMAQLGGVLAAREVGGIEDGVIFFMSIEKAKFRKPVVPGDQLRLVAELLYLRRNVCKLKTKAYVDDQVVCEAILCSMLVNNKESK
ncbi:MAG: 3-hydroxyacyl-[acyl-carrier-protein] dehydratase FabZ [Acidobacteria bacterium]|nr:MAG: 3-hydroxyacyl-[acyl-carrier-protein] dehydratase FabZ [Acidobacteriota bacterium]